MGTRRRRRRKRGGEHHRPRPEVQRGGTQVAENRLVYADYDCSRLTAVWSLHLLF